MQYPITHILNSLSPSQKQLYSDENILPSTLPYPLRKYLQKNHPYLKSYLAQSTIKSESSYTHIRITPPASKKHKFSLKNNLLKSIFPLNFRLNLVQQIVLNQIDSYNVIIAPTGTGKSLISIFYILKTLGYETKNEAFVCYFKECKKNEHDDCLNEILKLSKEFKKKSVTDKFAMENTIKCYSDDNVSSKQNDTIRKIEECQSNCTDSKADSKNESIKNNSISSSSKHHRIVYLTPLKSLNTQTHKNLKKYLPGLSIHHYHTNTPTTNKLFTSQIIITTPEQLLKLSIKYVYDISLLILDEVHLLNDKERGTFYELIISFYRNTRILVLSAFIKNLDEICFIVNGNGIVFGEEYKTVQVEKNIILLKDEKYEFKSDSDKKFSEINLNEKTSKNDDSLFKGNITGNPTFLNFYTKILDILLDQLTKKTIIFVRKIKNVLSLYNHYKSRFTCFFHHGKLEKKQSFQIISEFQRIKDKKVILFSTSSLAYGINLPADNVIVFDEFLLIDVFQMMGRAGREEFIPEEIENEEKICEDLEEENSKESAFKSYFITENDLKINNFFNLIPIESKLSGFQNILLIYLFLRKEEDVKFTLFGVQSGVNEEFNRIEESQNSVEIAKNNQIDYNTKFNQIEEQENDQFSCRAPYESLKSEYLKNILKNKSASPEFHSFYQTINSTLFLLLKNSLVFRFRNTLLLTSQGLIMTVYNIKYELIGKIREFRNEEEIFMILDEFIGSDQYLYDDENEPDHKKNHFCEFFPENTLIGKYLRNASSLNLIIKYLYCIFYLSVDQRISRNIYLIYELISLLLKEKRKEFLLISDYEDELVYFSKKIEFENVHLNGIHYVILLRKGEKEIKMRNFESHKKYLKKGKYDLQHGTGKILKLNVISEFYLGICALQRLIKHYSVENTGLILIEERKNQVKVNPASITKKITLRNSKNEDQGEIDGLSLFFSENKSKIKIYDFEELLKIRNKPFKECVIINMRMNVSAYELIELGMEKIILIGNMVWI